MARRRSGDYAVGYGKLPQHRLCQPGQSGNPKGRPKGSMNLGTCMARALAKKVAVTEGGQRRVITKAEAIAKQIVNGAARCLRASCALRGYAGADAF
jgi:hypothetical protein